MLRERSRSREARGEVNRGEVSGGLRARAVSGISWYGAKFDMVGGGWVSWWWWWW